MPTTSPQDATSTGITSPVFTVLQPIDASSLNDQDREFIAQTGAGNATEIAEGRLAMSNSDNIAVQVFGQWMATDHIVAGTVLSDIANQIGIPSDASPTPQQTQDIQSLRSQSGAAFDQLFAQGQVTDHQQTLALFQQEVANGQNATLKDIAQQAIPVLQQHLAGAQQLVVGIGGSDPSSDDAASQTGTSQQISLADTAPVAMDTAQTTADTLSAQDTSFVQFAAQSGLAEVQEGQ